jgi:hypothetical protein
MARKAKTDDFLTKAMALGKPQPVDDIPGLGMKVFVQSLSGAAVDAIAEQCLKPGKETTDDDAFDDEALTLQITVASIVDKKGKRLIPEGRESEWSKLPALVQAPLRLAALRANGMSGAAGN